MNDYKANYLFKHPHISTIYPSLFRKVANVDYERIRIDTHDNDFLDLDFKINKSQSSKKLVILSHGLEGSSDSPYIKSMINHLYKNGYDCLAWNCRTCSGEVHRSLMSYHMGKTDDFKTVIDYVIENYNYDSINLAGFSMGANISLKYLGENKIIPSSIKKTIVFSAPLSLRSTVDCLNSGVNLMYTKHFLSTLLKKFKKKEKEFIEFGIDVKKVYASRNLEDFDNHHTAPLYNFKNADDYYEKVHSLQFLKYIRVPTLIVNALNDPFLGPECYPKDISNPFVEIETPEHGGHVGFYMSEDISYADHRALKFLES
jgi:predicted alpha/beta-fold hydrolase